MKLKENRNVSKFFVINYVSYALKLYLYLKPCNHGCNNIIFLLVEEEAQGKYVLNPNKNLAENETVDDEGPKKKSMYLNTSYNHFMLATVF